MIRFLQQDNKVVKILFGVIIGAAVISMVIYLVPGLMDPSGGADNASIYATVHAPGFMGRLFGASEPIKTEDVSKTAMQMLQQQRIPESMMSQLLPLVMPRAGQVLVERKILKEEADRLHLQVSDDDLVRELKTGPLGEYLFPGGVFIGRGAS